MKNYFLFILLSFSSVICFCQEKTTLYFNDGTTKTGIYTIKKKTFTNDPSNLVIFSKETNEKYTLEDISKAIVHYSDTEKYYYEVLDVKVNLQDKKTRKKFGLLAYSSSNIKMYYVQVTIFQGGAIGMGTASGSSETYLKKTGDTIAYNLGYIYGAGPRGIKKRVRDYFSDCPSLVDLVDNNKINKEDTMEIVKYFEENCAK